MWTKMARERVVMQGLHAHEVCDNAHADECHAVYSSPLQYLYIMSFGTVPERTAFLATHAAPVLAPPPAFSAAENLAASDKNADIMREAMQDVRQQNMDAGADKKDGITGRFIAAGTAFAVMAIMRRSLDLFSLCCSALYSLSSSLVRALVRLPVKVPCINNVCMYEYTCICIYKYMYYIYIYIYVYIYIYIYINIYI